MRRSSERSSSTRHALGPGSHTSATSAARTSASRTEARPHEPIGALAAFAVLPFVWMATMAALTGGRRLMVEHGAPTRASAAASVVAPRTHVATPRAATRDVGAARATASRETAARETAARETAPTVQHPAPTRAR